MKIKALSHLAIFLLPLIFCSYRPANEADSQKEQFLMRLLYEGLSSSHYDPQKIDDKLSEKVYGLYIERLDFSKLFLLKPDVEELSKYKDLIDDEIKNSQFDFFDLSLKIINKRVEEASSYYKKILSKPFDFSEKESFEVDEEKRDFASSKEELKEMWRKYLKYRTLQKLSTNVNRQNQKESDSTKESFKDLEKNARNGIMKSMDNWFHRLSQVERSDRLAIYLNAYTSTYDPHTSYFPPKDKENFDIAFSGKLEGIGATLQEKDGYIEVQRIVPGSASWKQGELEAGDLIIKVGQGEEEPVDVVDMRLDNVVEMIRGKKGTEVRLTVKKMDGSIVVIPIIRDVVIIEETYAKAAVITKEGLGKFGYIDLPSFYADFNDAKGRNCSDDVKNAIALLKAENIDGLILDLRDNGGGSLPDAVDMSGLFIKDGPIVQVKTRAGAPHILKDKDPAIQYGGPLIVMVNSFSASASEILAAAMQDYHRAIIMGGTKTFGKGTVQQFVDLDQFLPHEYKDFKPLGSLKLTTQKFYRINGGATQVKGVTPDIIVPDAYNYIDVGEKEMDYPLPWDEISPVPYEKWNLSSDVIKDLASKSEKRVANDSVFAAIDQNAMDLKEQRDHTKYSLNFEVYNSLQLEKQRKSKRLRKMKMPIPGIDVVQLNTDKQTSATDSVSVAYKEEFKNSIKKDIYINEALHVLENYEGVIK